MKLFRVLDLVGKPVDGARADLRSRNADGSNMHGHLDETGPRMVTMKRVYIKREGGHKWLRWEWSTKESPIPHDCGYSGVRMDSKSVGDYYLLMEVAA